MSLRRRIYSFKYAFRGLYDLFQTQANARIHLAALAVVLWAGWHWAISPLEWATVVLCFIAVISLEAINTALEYLTDLISPQQQPLAGKAKDVAAAAVLWAAIGSVAVAGLIFIPKIFAS
ncbi:MAG: diacylglycerol kinase [Saprospiraceae bacterium]